MTDTNINSNINLYQKTIGLVYDVPNTLVKSEHFDFPHDAMSEWESQDTIDVIQKTWEKIGFNVILFPLVQNFLQRWTDESKNCDVIHSQVEGFGSLGREGSIPSLCELTGIPYIGSNPFVQSVCMDKNHVKMICRALKIPTARSYKIQNVDEIKNIKDDFFSTPHFIKPNGEGSGMGVDAKHSISSDKKRSIEIIRELLKLYPDGILVEKYLPGAEYTTGIIGAQKQFLPIAQIEVPDGVYGAANKSKDYLSEKVTFPVLPAKMQRNLEKYSQKLFSYLNMSDLVRFDWKCDEQGDVFFLEANTLPGVSKIYSPLIIMAKEFGIEYEDFFKILFESAYARRKDRNFWYAYIRDGRYANIDRVVC